MNILHLFLALIRTKSRDLLTHWAQVEPLGHYYKGHKQPRLKIIGGAFSSMTDTCVKAQQMIYQKCIPTFNDEMQNTPIMYCAYDNYNHIAKCKTTVNGKGSVAHIGTAYLAKEPPSLYIPVGTTMISHQGIPFTVTSCMEHGRSQYLQRYPP